MRKHLLHTFGFIAGLLITVSTINYFIDPHSTYTHKLDSQDAKNSYLNNFIEKLLGSKNGLGMEGWSPSDVKFRLASKTENFDCIMFGSSRIMGVSLYQGDGVNQLCSSFINLGVFGNNMETLARLLDIFTENKHHVKNTKVFIGVDYWTLNFSPNISGASSPRYNSIVRKIGINPLGLPEAFHENKPVKPQSARSLLKIILGELNAVKILFLNLANYDHFINSIKYTKKMGPKKASKNLRSLFSSYALDETFPYHTMPPFDLSKGAKTPVLLPDGGLANSAKYIKGHLNANPIPDNGRYRFTHAPWKNEGAIKLFSGMIRYLKSLGYEVILVLTPAHHSTWVKNDKRSETREVRGIRRKAMTIVTQATNKLAQRLQIKVIGSFDPKEIGCTENEFYEVIHPTPSCLNKIFLNSLTGAGL
jgi:hypothetical protein